MALAGAFDGLGSASVGEWVTGGEFMNELLAETAGGGGETPYRTGTSPTPQPLPHTISYFCGIATGDLIDAQNPGTGSLDGAINKGLRPRVRHHRSPAHQVERRRLQRFPPLLNSVPPVPGSASVPFEARRNPLMRWWSGLLAWWRRRFR